LVVPTQPFTVGVTIIVPDIAADPEFVPVKAAMLPVPVAAKPMAALLLVHAKVPPRGTLTKGAAGTRSPLHTVLSKGTETVGIGFMVMVKVVAGPVQMVLFAVTEIVAVIGVVPVFIGVKAGRFPLPEAANPIAGLVLVQAKFPPVGVLANTVLGIG